MRWQPQNSVKLTQLTLNLLNNNNYFRIFHIFNSIDYIRSGSRIHFKEHYNEGIKDKRINGNAQERTENSIVGFFFFDSEFHFLTKLIERQEQ